MRTLLSIAFAVSLVHALAGSCRADEGFPLEFAEIPTEGPLATADVHAATLDDAIADEGFSVARGPVATIEIGVETKILAKAMIKQIDRVIGDLIRQTEEFKRRGGRAICARAQFG